MLKIILDLSVTFLKKVLYTIPSKFTVNADYISIEVN